MIMFHCVALVSALKTEKQRVKTFWACFVEMGVQCGRRISHAHTQHRTSMKSLCLFLSFHLRPAERNDLFRRRRGHFFPSLSLFVFVSCLLFVVEIETWLSGCFVRLINFEVRLTLFSRIFVSFRFTSSSTSPSARHTGERRTRLTEIQENFFFYPNRPVVFSRDTWSNSHEITLHASNERE